MDITINANLPIMPLLPSLGFPGDYGYFRGTTSDRPLKIVSFALNGTKLVAKLEEDIGDFDIEGYVVELDSEQHEKNLKLRMLTCVYAFCVSLTLPAASLINISYSNKNAKLLFDDGDRIGQEETAWREIEMLVRSLIAKNIIFEFVKSEFNTDASQIFQAGPFEFALLAKPLFGTPKNKLLVKAKKEFLTGGINTSRIGPFTLDAEKIPRRDGLHEINLSLSNTWMYWFGERSLNNCQVIDVQHLGLY